MNYSDYSVSVRMRGSLRRFAVVDVADETPESGFFSHIAFHVTNARCGLRRVMYQDIVNVYNRHTGLQVVKLDLIRDIIQRNEAPNFCDFCECFVPDARWAGDRCRGCHDRILAELEAED